MFDWNDLKYFLAVARNGSTLAAARSLRLSQSTVHRRLEELERKLGHPLVKRHPTGYRLTELGIEMRDYAERVENAISDFERRVSAWGKELSGIVRVTCPEALGPRLIHSGLIAKFNDRYPALRVEIVMNDKVVDLAKGQADIAIRTVPSDDGALIGRKIADSPRSVYASRSYVKRHGGIARPEDIDRHAVVVFGGEMRGHHSAEWIRSVAPNARIAARANSLPALLMAAKSGAGITPMPIIVGDSEPDLVRLLDSVPTLATPFYLLMHGDMKKTPRVRAFFDFVVEELPAVRPWLTGKIVPAPPRKSDRKRRR
jgi:DNA-binding transcriptional LysR family regulator